MQQARAWENDRGLNREPTDVTQRKELKAPSCPTTELLREQNEKRETDSEKPQNDIIIIPLPLLKCRLRSCWCQRRSSTESHDSKKRCLTGGGSLLLRTDEASIRRLIILNIINIMTLMAYDQIKLIFLQHFDWNNSTMIYVCQLISALHLLNIMADSRR